MLLHGKILFVVIIMPVHKNVHPGNLYISNVILMKGYIWILRSSKMVTQYVWVKPFNHQWNATPLDGVILDSHSIKIHPVPLAMIDQAPITPAVGSRLLRVTLIWVL